jgi:hypothetical protein
VDYLGLADVSTERKVPRSYKFFVYLEDLVIPVYLLLIDRQLIVYKEGNFIHHSMGTQNIERFRKK